VKTTLLDTGPLVAYLNRRDRHHGWAKRALEGLRPPLETCDPVLSEACFLLSRGGIDPTLPLVLLDRGVLRSAFSAHAEARPLARLMTRYRDVPMSLADACLVRMSELHDDCQLVTLDSDFAIYRRHGRRRIPTVSP
jgi:predicted nucleic acid-binding protein